MLNFVILGVFQKYILCNNCWNALMTFFPRSTLKYILLLSLLLVRTAPMAQLVERPLSEREVVGVINMVLAAPLLTLA